MKRIFRVLIEDEAGQAATEFALVVPLLLLVLFAIFDLGRAVFYWNDENHVANLGARYAAVGGNWPQCGGQTQATLAAFVACEAGADTNGGLTESNSRNGVNQGINVSVTAPSGATTAGSPVTVRVCGKYNYVPFLAVPRSTITGTATMMLEQTLPASNSVISTYSPGGETC